MPEKNHLKFTKPKIEALPIPVGKDRPLYHDTLTPGLCLRVGRAGKVFYFYRWVNGKPAWLKLGKFPHMTVEQARRKTEELLGAAARGEDLKQASGSTHGEWTFERLFEWYLTNFPKKQKKTEADYRMYYRLYFQVIAHKKLSRICKDDLRTLQLGIKRQIAARLSAKKEAAGPLPGNGDRTGNYAANKAIRIIRAIFNTAIAEDKFKGKNPAIGIEGLPEEDRERRLWPADIPRLFEAIEAEPNETIRDYVLISLLSGARKSNVLEMSWDQVDLDGGVWRIPRTKNGKPQHVPLLAEELDILRRRKSTGAGAWVFSGDGATGHMLDPRKGWLRILERAGIKDIRLHDLRRTLGSFMGDTGADLALIGKALNHQSHASTLIYHRLCVGTIAAAKARAHEAIKRSIKNDE